MTKKPIQVGKVVMKLFLVRCAIRVFDPSYIRSRPARFGTVRVDTWPDGTHALMFTYQGNHMGESRMKTMMLSMNDTGLRESEGHVMLPIGGKFEGLVDDLVRCEIVQPPVVHYGINRNAYVKCALNKKLLQ